MPYKILHVITTINKGGAENHLFSLAKQQAILGNKVTVAYLKGDGYWQDSLSSCGVDVVSLKLKFYGDPFPIFALGKTIRDFKPDLIHAHMPPAELYVFFSLLIFSQDLIFFISKHNDEKFFNGPFAKFLSRLIANRSKNIIAISEAVNIYFRKVFPSTVNIKTIHYGINPEEFLQSKKSDIRIFRHNLSLEPNVLVFCCIARLTKQKSIDILLKSFAKYKFNNEYLSKLLIIGEGELKKNLQQLASKLNIIDNVIFLGFRDDIATAMSSIDVFVLTSRYEGFGLVLLEAMAASKPIVATSVSAIPEIVLNNKTGLLCTSGDVVSISDSFKKMENKVLRTKLGKAGRIRLKKEFSIEKMVQETSLFYEKTLQNNKVN
jgi:glycosyltransferase involved in cell wall biosynthesis